MPGRIANPDDLSDEQKSTLDTVKRRFDAADRLHREFRDRWDIWYGLSRNWRRLSGDYAQATTPRDKDIVRDQIRRTFGEELFIPYGFTVIETNAPRICAQPPKAKALPNDEAPATLEALQPVEQLYERDNRAMHYERELQETVRSGLRYGLGVQKQYWDKKTRDGKALEKRFFGLGRKVIDEEIVVYEGPRVESVDIFDFFWDPAAKDLKTANYVIHRTWRNMDYVKRKVEEGRRKREEGIEYGCWLDLDLEEIERYASSTKRGEVWDGRMQAAGLSNYSTEGDREFEIWEYHDRDQVITVLGRELLVQEDVNPFLHGEYPFDIYRPTIVEHEFVGVGEIEPIAHLQWELNTLRGQRRDAATLALNRGYFYQRGTIDPADIVTGVGVFNPVNAPPDEAIQPMPFTDIPQSGVEEERAMKSDIELTTAMSEAVVGSGGEDTATGTQLVQNAANLRIQGKARNLYVDLLVPEFAKRRALYEQHIVAEENERPPMRIEDPTRPTGFAFVSVGPEQLSANLEVVPIKGSTEPENPQQKRSDATELASALAPFMEVVDVQKLLRHILAQFDVDQPDEWFKQPEPEGPDPGQIIQAVGQAMQEQGIEEEQITEILEAAFEAVQQAPPEGEEGGGPEEPEPSAPEGEPERIGA